MAPLPILSCLFLLISSLWIAGNVHAQERAVPGASAVSEVEPKPLVVAIGIKIDQITFVDQKSENFGAVAVIRMRWKDPKLAFDATTHKRDYKIFEVTDFKKHAEDLVTIAPRIVINNQQNKRWIQQQFVVVESDGTADYYESSSVQLQAPYFNFVDYPFDSQSFLL